MISRIRIIDNYGTNPYQNLALEQYLTERVGEGECILYLWQNAGTIVIGRNQNAWKECDVSAVREDGAKIARRLSGGGAVFHDMGNLNFTFIMRSEDYDVPRQLSVIIRACKAFGIEAKMTGRNDLVVASGAKFSGNAFYHHPGRSYHHGTILVDVDKTRMGRYLRPHPEKLKAKGVDSVRSRVINLSELAPEMTAESMREAMKNAFREVYGGTGESDMSVEDIGSFFVDPELKALVARYESEEWNLGEKCEYDSSFAERFEWGTVEICLKVRKDEVVSAKIYTDSMETGWTDRLERAFGGVSFSYEGLRSAVRGFAEDAQREAGAPQDGQAIPRVILNDIEGMVERYCAETFRGSGL